MTWGIVRTRIDLPMAARRDIRDVDVDGDGQVLAVAGDRICFGDAYECALPAAMRFPMVRWFGPEAALLIDTRCREPRANAFIVDARHGVTARFNVGDGVEDALRTENHIVVSYFDEGVFGGTLGRLGVAVFDLQGRLLWGWNDRVAGSGAAEFIDDCHGIVAIGPDRIAVHAFSEMQLVALDLAAGSAALLAGGLESLGCMSERDGVYHFRDRDTLSSGRPEDGRLMLSRSAVADGNMRQRGLAGGRFLAFAADEAWLETVE